MSHLYFSKYGKHGNEEILYVSCSVLTVFIFWHCEQILLLFVFYFNTCFNFLFKYSWWTIISNMTRVFYTLGTNVSTNNIFYFLFKTTLCVRNELAYIVLINLFICCSVSMLINIKYINCSTCYNFFVLLFTKIVIIYLSVIERKLFNYIPNNKWINNVQKQFYLYLGTIRFTLSEKAILLIIHLKQCIVSICICTKKYNILTIAIIICNKK